MKNVKREFKVYSDFERHVILTGLKADASLRLRVPLVTLIEHKGVVALAMDQGYLGQ